MRVEMPPVVVAPEFAPCRRRRLLWIPLQPLDHAEVIELLAPDQAGERLPLNVGYGRIEIRSDRAIEGVGLPLSGLEEALRGSRRQSLLTLPEPQSDHLRLARPQFEAVDRRALRSRLLRIDRIQIAVHDVPMEGVFDVAGCVRCPEDPLVVGVVAGENPLIGAARVQIIRAQIGMLGVLEDAQKMIGLAPKEPCEFALLRVPITIEQRGLGASAYAALLGAEDGYPIEPNVPGEKALCALLAKSAHEGWIASAHDLSEGGLAVAAAEIAMKGWDVVFSLPEGDEISQLFGEFPGSVIVGLEGDGLALESAAKSAGLEFQRLGFSSPGSELTIRIGGELALQVSGEEMKAAYEGAFA